MRSVQVPCRHREDEVGDLDAVEHVGVEDNDMCGHRARVPSGLLVEAELFGVGCHGVERLVGPCFEAVAVRENIDELQAPMGADHVVWNFTGLDLLDQVWAAHVQQLGCLDRGQLGMQRDDRHAVAGSEVLHDRHQQRLDPLGQLDRVAVGSDQPWKAGAGSFQGAHDGFQHLGAEGVGSDFEHVTHGDKRIYK